MSEKMHQRIRSTIVLPEALEARRLLAGIEAGVLVARGTGGNDTISLRRSGGDDVIVTTNGVNQTFDMDNFTGVRLEGFGGNDAFRMIDALVSPVVRNTTVLGGDGEDTLDYSTRTDALDIAGYEVPDAESPYPFVRVRSGTQEDRVDQTVERFIGGSAGDTFTFDGQQLDDPVPQLTLEGRGGNDFFRHVADLRATLYGGDGDDSFGFDDERTIGSTVYGGAGNDTFGLSNFGFPSALDAGPGIDRMTAFNSFRELIDISGFAGLENVIGIPSGAGITVIGNGLNNLIAMGDESESGGTTLRGMGGDDTLIGGFGDELLDGGEGNDSIVGGLGDDTIDGGPGVDTVDGGPGDNTILNAETTPAAPQFRVVSGLLTVDGSWGQDLITIERVGGDDVIVRVNNVSRTFDMDDFTGVLLRGNNGYDDLRILQPIVAGSLVRKVTLEGGAGNDTLTGNSGDDVLRGGTGNDLLLGEGGRDALFGQGGNDDLLGGFGLDFMDGGDDDDFLDSRDDDAPGDTVLGGNGNDRAWVNAGDNTSNVENVMVA